MRLLLMTFLYFFVAISFARPSHGAQWGVLNFPAQGHLTGISFPTQDTGYVVTNDGNIGRTNDGGRNWFLHRLPLRTPLEDCSFLNVQTGVVCGRSGVVHLTTNGGATWKNISVADTLCRLASALMVDASTIIVTGMRPEKNVPLTGVVYRTDNAGKTWKRLTVSGLGFGDLSVRGRNVITFPAYGRLFESKNAGLDWQSRKTGLMKPTRLILYFGRKGMTVGNEAVCAFSNDYGRTWDTTKVGPAPDVHFTSGALLDSMQGYVGGTRSCLYMTQDGGKTWTKESLPRQLDILDMAVAGKLVYAIGSRGTILVKKVR